MECYNAIEAEAVRIIRRRPAWLDTLNAADGPIHRTDIDPLARICRTIRNERTNPEVSDRLVVQLIEIARAGEANALTVLLHASARTIRSLVRTNATPEYHADVLSALAMDFLGDPILTHHIVKRTVSRVHNKVWRQRVAVRRRGKVNVVTVRPFDPTILARVSMNHDLDDDVADTAVRNADLVAFARIAEQAAADGFVSAFAWEHYRDLHLKRALVDVDRRNTDRVRAHRAILQIHHLAERHLIHHAA